MGKIKNVIFDLGGVLLNLDYNKTKNAFQELGYTDFEKMYSMFQANNIFDNLEMGHIHEDAFYEYMLEAGSGSATKEQVTEAWNAMLLDFREGSINFLKELSKTHKLFLLSNTNIIHKASFEAGFKKQTGIDSLDSLFTKAYYSHNVGMRKPNENIFKFLLEDAGIKPEETLFVDDLFANIETAKKLGIKTHQLMSGEKIEDLDYK